MFYLIYLFTSLILICNNLVESNEGVQNVIWNCASENCDRPIAEIKTTNKYKVKDHDEKLTFESGMAGILFKKPSDNSEYIYAEINQQRGYVNKNYVRETKLLNKADFKVGGTLSINEAVKISPSQPTVVDGTTIYDNDLSESDHTKSFSSFNSQETTSPLSSTDIPSNIQNNHQSILTDSVESFNPGVQIGAINKAESDEMLLKKETADNITVMTTDPEEKRTVVENNLSKNDDSREKSAGFGTVVPVDDDEGLVEEEVQEEEFHEGQVQVPSMPLSTNGNPWEQTDSNDSQNSPSPTFETNPAEPDSGEGFVPNVLDIQNQSDTSTGTEQQQQIPNIETMDKSQTLVNENIPENPYLEANRIPAILSSSESSINLTPSTEIPSQSRYIYERSTNTHKNNEYDFKQSDSDGQGLYMGRMAEPVPSQPSEIPIGPNLDATSQPSTSHSFVEQVMDGQESVEFPNTDNKPEEFGHDTTTATPNQLKNEHPMGSESEPVPTQPSKIPININEQVQSQGSEIPIDQNKGPLNSLNQGKIVASSVEYNTMNIDPNLGATNQPSTSHSSTNQPSSDQQVMDGQESVDVPIADNKPEEFVNDTTDATPDQLKNEHPSDFEWHGTNSQETSTQKTSSASEDSVMNIDNSNKELSPVEITSVAPPPNDATPPDSTNEKVIPVQQDLLTSTSPPIDSLDAHDSIIEENSQKDFITSEESLTTTEPYVQDSSEYYSSVTSFFGSLKELFVKSELPSDEGIEAKPDVNEVITEAESEHVETSTAPPGYCYEGAACGGLERPIGGEDQLTSSWGIQYPSVDLFKNPAPLSFNSMLYICVTSVVILLFSLGYYYIDKSQNSSILVGKVNQLSQELFVTKKERDTLEDQLLKFKENFNVMDSSKHKQDSKLSSLQDAFKESEAKNVQLEETVMKLEKEVETLMDQGMEMHKLLSETITEEERSQMLLANIEELKQSLGEKLNEIVSLTNQLDKKNHEIQMGQIDIRNANDRVTELERKLESCKSDIEGTFTKKLQGRQQQLIKLQQVLEEKGVSIAKLENELAKTKGERDSAEARASSAEAGLQAAHSVGAGEARQVWMESTNVRAELATAKKSNDSLQTSISELNNTNKSLQDKISTLNVELSDLNSKYESVEKEKVNAFTKLQVLSDYFKEKESKLQEELGMKESLWLEKEFEDHTIYEQMKSLRQEIASYKAQNDKLKSEILEQEASYKVQIANEEQKSYDNWVALRQSERKFKELQMESAHFRNRLTQLETANQSTVDALNPNGLEKGSFSAPSPPFMMLPPLPPNEFFSLPPPPLHPSASRPPPLGRISSPQLSGEMLPPPPIMPFDMYPPPPPSSLTPPPPLPIYKPQPRDRPPPPKDSPPSNYSSESVNDKSHRRRRR